MVDRLNARAPVAIRHWPVVLLRVYTGLFFAWNGFAKLRMENFADWMGEFLQGQLDSSFAFYRPFIEAAVLPNKTLFAALVSWGELTVGLLMIVGLGTRYAAAIGAFLVLNFWFARGLPLLSGTNQDVAWLMVFVVLGTIPAGKIAGLDDGLADRLPFLR